jgi:hypothetical protein
MINIVRTFVNVTMYPQYNNNMIIKKERKKGRKGKREGERERRKDRRKEGKQHG